jgi:uncharacterized protein YjbJ (UPF0337 family)
MANLQVAEGNWTELKGEIMTKWGQLTDHDLTTFKGSVKELAGLIQQKTGQARESIDRQLDEIITGGAQIASRTVESAHNGYEYAAYQADEAYQQAEAMIKSRPVESMAVVFGAGVAIGVLFGLAFRR